MEKVVKRTTLIKSLLFIESNLHEKILLKDAATVAGFSEHDYHRLFKSENGGKIWRILKQAQARKSPFWDYNIQT